MPINPEELRASVEKKLREKFNQVKFKSKSPKIYLIDGKIVNLRVRIKKDDNGKCFFDVAPSLLEKGRVDFFIYACASTEDVYIFPASDFSVLVKEASVSRQGKLVFDIYIAEDQLAPAGLSGIKFNIKNYYNNYDLIG
jgi:hypothetical protein